MTGYQRINEAGFSGTRGCRDDKQQDVDAVQEALVALGSEQIGDFDKSLFKNVEYKAH